MYARTKCFLFGLLTIGLVLGNVKLVGQNKGAAAQAGAARDSEKGKNIIAHEHLSELDLLKNRVARLEEEIDALKANGVRAGHPIGKVNRTPRPGKGDSAEEMQLQINRIWNQLDAIMQKMDELTSRT